MILKFVISAPIVQCTSDVHRRSNIGLLVYNIVNEEPYVGTPVYIRGALNDWGTNNELEYQGGRTYIMTMDIEPGNYEFKVASEDWDTVNFGALSADDADRNVNVGQTTALARTNDNLLKQVIVCSC